MGNQACMINNSYFILKDGIDLLTIHISLQQIDVEYLLCVLHILDDVKKNKSCDVH